MDHRKHRQHDIISLAGHLSSYLQSVTSQIPPTYVDNVNFPNYIFVDRAYELNVMML